jgi:phospholipid/cholesterol/gamma-HCH transport system ATP-binding protein
MISNLVELANVRFAYDFKQPILQGVTLQIPPGKIVAIMGPSGTGKTTLLKLISGQAIPSSGVVRVFGEDLSGMSEANLYRLRQRMGMLFQGGALFTHLSVYENVAYPLREHTNLTEQLLRSLVLLKLQMVGLRGACNMMPHDLSGGMVRRVALARAIALDPELIIYDEPFAGQDPITKGVLIKLIKTLNNLGATTIIVSHDVPEILQIADIVYIVAEGVVIAVGTPQQIIEHEAPAIKQFIAGLPDGKVPFHYPAPLLAQDFLGERQ